MAITMLMQEVISKVKEISEISGYVSFIRKPFFSLAGRLTVMLPFFEEMRDVVQNACCDLYEALTSLLDHLEATRKLLQQGSKGSKIYLVLEREEIRREYEAVLAALEEDLHRVCCRRLDDVSFEVKEYAIHVLHQFERDRTSGNLFNALADHDAMYEDLLSLYEKVNDDDGVIDLEVLKGLIDALGLRKATALQQEYAALTEIADARGGDPENIEKMFMVLNYIKEFLHTDKESHVDSSPGESYIGAREGIADITNYDNKVIPNEFLCPISLQMMEDPVIISSGQTYERKSIERWLDAGNGTCPKTRQFLTDATLTPNHALRCLIVQWRETNRIDAPKAASTTSYCISPAERRSIMRWIVLLEIGQEHYHQRQGSGELYQLAKRSAEIREAIGEAGAIPLLRKALQTTDLETKENAMAALLNLSISPQNKSRIVQDGVIPEIIGVMNSGSLKACEDGATILLSLSYLNDDVKFLIGSHEGLRPLVYLLREGTERGQKEAAAALFNLCLMPCNIKRAVGVGVVSEIISLMGQRYSPVRDEALALLDTMASHHDVLRALERESLTSHLIEFLSRGSRKNQEDAASVLLQLGSLNLRYVEEARELGVVECLMEVQRYGSDEGKRKASVLLENIATYEYRTGIKRPWIDHTSEASTSRSKPRPRGGTD